MGSVSPKDFIGVLAILGGEIAEGSVKFANVYPWWHLLTRLFVVPGLYKLATLLLKRNCLSIGLAFCSGIRDNEKVIAGFKANNKYRYIGVQSGTNAPVLNEAFEAFISVKTRGLDKPGESSCFREGKGCGKKTKVYFAEAKKTTRSHTVIQANRGAIRDQVCACVLQVCSIAVLLVAVLCFEDGDAKGLYVSVIIVVCNWASYILITFSVQKDEYMFAKNSVTEGVKQGNCIVTDLWGNNMWAIKVDETVVQDLIRDKISTNRQAWYRDYMEFFVAVFGCGTSVATVLLTPAMSTKGQIVLAIELLIGLAASMTFSSKDSELFLCDIATSYYNIQTLKAAKFTNRATAVAASTLFLEGESSQITEDLLPRTEPFNDYRDLLDTIVRMGKFSKHISFAVNHLKKAGLINMKHADDRRRMFARFTECKDLSASTSNDKIDLWQDKLESGKGSSASTSVENVDSWPNRLLLDAVEAFVHVHITMPENHAGIAGTNAHKVEGV